MVIKERILTISEIGIQLYFQVYISDFVWGEEDRAGGERSEVMKDLVALGEMGKEVRPDK